MNPIQYQVYLNTVLDSVDFEELVRKSVYAMVSCHSETLAAYCPMCFRGY